MHSRKRPHVLVCSKWSYTNPWPKNCAPTPTPTHTQKVFWFVDLNLYFYFHTCRFELIWCTRWLTWSFPNQPSGHFTTSSGDCLIVTQYVPLLHNRPNIIYFYICVGKCKNNKKNNNKRTFVKEACCHPNPTEALFGNLNNRKHQARRGLWLKCIDCMPWIYKLCVFPWVLKTFTDWTGLNSECCVVSF